MVGSFVRDLGYEFLFRPADYSLEEVQSILRETGPSAFLDNTSLAHDISPRAPLPAVEDFISARLARLAPTTELVIVDPYFFPSRPHPSVEEYAASVGRLVSPLLNERVKLTVVVDQPDSGVQAAVERVLASARSPLAMKVVRSKNFHDRFWIADRSRGTILGSSLNKIGSRIFFIDALSDQDLGAVLSELAICGV